MPDFKESIKNKIPNPRAQKKREAGMSEYMFGKLPPQASSLEEAVLGAIMLSKDALTVVIDTLRPESFYVDAHQAIYKAMVRLFERTQPIDLLTVSEELKKTAELEKVGGPYYLVELTNRVASSANLEYHARLVAQKFIQRELIRVSTEVIKDAYEDTTDVFELLDKAEQGLFEITEKNLSRSYSSMSSLLGQAVKQVEEASKSGEGLTGVPTGFVDLDRMTSGWQPSDLVIVAARPGMGKTSFTLALAANASILNKPVAFFSLEMSSIQLVKRLISMETEIHGEKLKNGKLEDYEWQQLNTAIERMSDRNIFIDDTPAINIFELRAKCRRLKMQHDIQMVMIDYLQLMTGSMDNNRNGNREQEISSISRALKGLAKELNIPVIALSQLSRAVETRGGTKRPQLSDLRECIVGNTKIYIADTGEYKRVDELIGQKGFNVLALDEAYKLQEAECLDVWETDEKEVYEVVTQSGNKITASLNHPFFTALGWQQLVDLKVGDFVAVKPKVEAKPFSSPQPPPKGEISRSARNFLRKSPPLEGAQGVEYATKTTTLPKQNELQGDIKWDKIKSITHIGKEMTYDLHIADHHNFVANDFIIHNSGAIEQDADMVTFIYRPEYYQIMEDEEGNSLKGKAEVIIAKHRNGALGTVDLRFTGETAKFSDWGDGFDAFPTSNDDFPSPASNIITRPSRMNDDFEDVPF